MAAMGKLYISFGCDKMDFVELTKETAIERINFLRWDVILGLAVITVPFMLGGPQWLVGTIVNTILFLGAMKVEKKNWWLMVVLPSMAVAARGLIFGPFTWFLIYFMPVIWLGNLVLMYLFSRVKGWEGVGIASLVKVLILFGAASIYFRMGLIPRMFLRTMGIMQLMTAMAGGIIAIYLMRTVLAGRGQSSQK